MKVTTALASLVFALFAASGCMDRKTFHDDASTADGAGVLDSASKQGVDGAGANDTAAQSDLGGGEVAISPDAPISVPDAPAIVVDTGPTQTGGATGAGGTAGTGGIVTTGGSVGLDAPAASGGIGAGGVDGGTGGKTSIDAPVATGGVGTGGASGGTGGASGGTKAIQGAACTTTSDCAAGSCADNAAGTGKICCASACSNACQACTSDGSACTTKNVGVADSACGTTTTCHTGICGSGGICQLASAGTNCGSNLYCTAGGQCTCQGGGSCQPSNVCQTGTYSCATGTAVCQASGNQPTTVACGLPQSCSGATKKLAQMCNGSGACATQVSQPCTYRCNAQGTDCDNTNYCSPTPPCQNGGTCTNTTSTYTCSCTGGYYGTNCENAHFEWLGLNYADVRGISADGTVVVGSMDNGSSIWVPARGTTGGAKPNWVTLSYNAGPLDGGSSWATNTDGSVIVGYVNIAGGGGAFRWTAASGIVVLGLGVGSTATGVTANGTTVVGARNGSESTPTVHGYRWTASAATDLGSFGTAGLVSGVNSDGSVVVGGYTPTTAGEVPFRWTQNTGYVQLGNDITGFASYATAISLDGSTVVGNVTGPFRYVNSGGFAYISLGALTSASVFAVNGDGTVVGGSSSQGPWIWDTSNGVRLLTTVLTGFGADLSNWSSMSVAAISSNGKTIAGTGYRSGTYTSWVARL
jgi:hypothetical protein